MCILPTTHATLFPVTANFYFRPLSYSSRSTLKALHLGFGKFFLKIDDGTDPSKLYFCGPFEKQSHLLVFTSPTWKYLVLFGPLSHPPPSLDCFSLVQRASPSQNFFMAHRARKSGSLLRCISLSVQHFSVFYI